MVQYADMARPRSFNEADIRSKLLRSFWEGGFDGTSLPDLEAATELSRKSLYNTFGDKRDMFLSALRDFRRYALDANTKPLQESNASLAAISTVLKGLVTLSRSAEGQAGCMVCNTAREAIRHDPAVKTEIDAYFRQLEDRFLVAIRNGQTLGDIRIATPEPLARLCVGAVVSISVLSKAGQPAELLDAIVDETLTALQ